MKTIFATLLAAASLASPILSADALELTATPCQSEIIPSHLSAYWFQVNGNPHTTYRLLGYRLNGKLACDHEVTCIDGHLATTAGTRYTYATASTAPGEPINYFLHTSTGEMVAQTQVVPRPLSSSANGYDLSMQLGDAQARSFNFTASGFKPGEEVIITVTAGSRTTSNAHTVPPSGTLKGAIAPGQPSEVGGPFRMMVTGSSGEVSLSDRWGVLYTHHARQLAAQSRPSLKEFADTHSDLLLN